MATFQKIVTSGMASSVRKLLTKPSVWLYQNITFHRHLSLKDLQVYFLSMFHLYDIVCDLKAI